jgi:NTE family protein
MAAEEQSGNYVDLVCEGGGVKGIGLAGAYSMLEERGYEPRNVAGTSAGAITAALIAAGYSADELKEIIVSLDYGQFQDEDWKDKLGKAASIYLDQGIYEGEAFYKWIKEKLEEKEIRTFRDLVIEGETDPRYRSRLQVIVSDVTGRRLLVLPSDAVKLGYDDPDDLEVALAIRMSMSIPIFFEPVRVKNEKTDTEHIIVDGGMLSNFPVWLFDVDPGEEPGWPTFGLLLVEPEPKKPIGHRLEQERDRGVTALVDYVKAMAQTMMEAHDRIYLEKEQFARTIPIPTLGVGTTEFDITKERALALYESGREATAKFLETWDFPAYVEQFRRGKEYSRREEVVEELRVAAGTR